MVVFAKRTYRLLMSRNGADRLIVPWSCAYRENAILMMIFNQILWQEVEEARND